MAGVCDVLGLSLVACLPTKRVRSVLVCFVKIAPSSVFPAFVNLRLSSSLWCCFDLTPWQCTKITH